MDAVCIDQRKGILLEINNLHPWARDGIARSIRGKNEIMVMGGDAKVLITVEREI